MPESVPSSLVIDAFKEIFQAERRGAQRQDPLGWIISVPDTHQKSVLAALDKERSLRGVTCPTEDDANAVAARLYMTREPVIVMMKREEILTLVAGARGTAICVPTMTAAPAWRTSAPADLSVGCVGFMGGASALGLGLALGAPDRRVIVFDGDGSLLMQLGSLATIAGAAPRNFTHLLFKNGVSPPSGRPKNPPGPTAPATPLPQPPPPPTTPPSPSPHT